MGNWLPGGHSGSRRPRACLKIHSHQLHPQSVTYSWQKAIFKHALKQDNNTSVEKIRFFASNVYDTISRDKI